MLPWTIAVRYLSLTPDNAWSYYAIVFGGSLVVGFCFTLVTVGIWAWYVLIKYRKMD